MTKAVPTFSAYTISREGRVRYVGITTRAIERRWVEHRCSRLKKLTALARAISKFGASSFEFEHVACAWDQESLNDLEVILISQHRTLSPSGYNHTTGGGQGVKFDAETRAKMSSIAKETHSRPEVKARLSAGATRRFSTADGRAAQSQSQKKRWAAPEARKAQAERARAQYQVPGAREALSEQSKRWFCTEEAKLKNSARVRARLADPVERAKHGQRVRDALARPEVKERMSQSQKKRWAENPDSLAKVRAAHKTYFDCRRAEKASIVE